MKSRRNFLKALGIGAAGVAATPFISKAQAPIAAVPSSVSDIVPVMLTPGESRISPESLEKYGDVLHDINRGPFHKHSAVNSLNYWIKCGDQHTIGTNLELRMYDQGIESLLNIYFNGGKAPKYWHFGLIDANRFTAICNKDRYKDINQAGNGWDEFTNYSTWYRPLLHGYFDSGTFQFTGPGTIRGIFIVGGDSFVEIKENHDSGGVLFSRSLFMSDISVVAGDKLKVWRV